eukprot:XP_022262517.1 uncharacterized protein LOC100688922 isoform X1 [Canis lupus familiaris]
MDKSLPPATPFSCDSHILRRTWDEATSYPQSNSRENRKVDGLAQGHIANACPPSREGPRRQTSVVCVPNGLSLGKNTKPDTTVLNDLWKLWSVREPGCLGFAFGEGEDTC